MMREAEVDAIFSAWLERHGWSAEKSRSGLDILTRRGDRELRVELKSVTKEWRIDADIFFGHILRYVSRANDPLRPRRPRLSAWTRFERCLISFVECSEYVCSRPPGMDR